MSAGSPTLWRGKIFSGIAGETTFFRRVSRGIVLRAPGSHGLASQREPEHGPREPLMARTRKPVVEVRRSQRRRRTVSAYREGERVVVLIPDRFSRAEETEWVARMLERLAAREERIRRTDSELLIRARRLITRYLPDHAGDIVPASVRWVTNQNGRWGSCT